ncbi:MAG: YceI family protein, partial [Pseudomonadota bacterium]
MKVLSTILASVLFTSGLLPVRADQRVVSAQSEIAFTSKQMGVPVEGKFRKFEAQIAFDPKSPAASTVILTIDLASASLGAADTEAELAKPEWFSTKRFPQATFQSTAITSAGAGKFNVSGKLSIKSISRDLVVPITLTQMAGQTTASGKF